MEKNVEHNLNKDSQDATVSPFTLVFEKGSLDAVAQIMNVVILITVSPYTALLPANRDMDQSLNTFI